MSTPRAHHLTIKVEIGGEPRFATATAYCYDTEDPTQALTEAAGRAIMAVVNPDYLQRKRTAAAAALLGQARLARQIGDDENAAALEADAHDIRRGHADDPQWQVTR